MNSSILYVAPYPPSVTRLTLFLSLSNCRSDHGYTFDAAYTSHSRGWSSGATSALSFYFIGLTITSQSGSTFRIEPQPGNILRYMELLCVAVENDVCGSIWCLG
ncbi:glycoside hydrolase family 78 protein [Sphaerobolus stellatus SS14]|uniref:Glycoside hydrolase family 78 protein n=1 Tax=Sphaerobolus stellatus (strain SS14) TaxID=990650 RepID=A0A0C9UFP0_SPHS4|nr:glycoside hydrolase family 78 protein [Sphaerobolus stellatus SS14]